MDLFYFRNKINGMKNMENGLFQRLFSLCLNEASKSNLLFRHGCIATYGGKIMCKGCNTTTSSTDNFIRNRFRCRIAISQPRFIKYTNFFS